MKRISRSGIGTTAGFGLAAFSRDELDSIHYATLQILQDTGIKVLSENALEIFHGGGCEIERFEGYGIVKIPSYVVEECVFWAPRTIVYDARNPDDAPLGMLIPTLVLAGLCIFFGIAAFIPVSVAEKAASMLLGGM